MAFACISSNFILFIFSVIFNNTFKFYENFSLFYSFFLDFGGRLLLLFFILLNKKILLFPIISIVQNEYKFYKGLNGKVINLISCNMIFTASVFKKYMCACMLLFFTLENFAFVSSLCSCSLR